MVTIHINDQLLYRKIHHRARQRCFWLLAFISRPQVRNIHLPGQVILPGSLIPSDKYFLKNLTLWYAYPLVWLRHHLSQTLYQQEEVVIASVASVKQELL